MILLGNYDNPSRPKTFIGSMESEFVIRDVNPEKMITLTIDFEMLDYRDRVPITYKQTLASRGMFGDVYNTHYDKFKLDHCPENVIRMRIYNIQIKDIQELVLSLGKSIDVEHGFYCYNGHYLRLYLTNGMLYKLINVLSPYDYIWNSPPHSSITLQSRYELILAFERYCLKHVLSSFNYTGVLLPLEEIQFSLLFPYFYRAKAGHDNYMTHHYGPNLRCNVENLKSEFKDALGHLRRI